MPNELQDAGPEESIQEGADYLPIATAALNPQVHWLRIAYVVEFLLALQISLTVWSEVGGQGHMDLLPWYVKIVTAGLFSWSIVRFSAALAEQSEFWSKRSRRWFGAALLLSGAMALITYYYHLHEAFDDPDSDETSTTSVEIRKPGHSRTA